MYIYKYIYYVIYILLRQKIFRKFSFCLNCIVGAPPEHFK